MLPQNTILGHLEIIEIYEFYNHPVLFTCQNRVGHHYIVTWVDETPEHNEWLYVPLSPHRLNMVRRGQVDLHDTFVQPEDDVVLHVIASKYESDAAQIQTIPISQLDQSWAPLPGDYLDFPDSLPQVLWEDVDQRSGATEAPLPLVVA